MSKMLELFINTDPVNKIIIILLMILIVVGALIGLWQIPFLNNISKKKKKARNPQDNPHVNCEFYRDLMAMQERVTIEGEKAMRKAVVIETVTTLREQMKEAEAFLLSIRDLYKSTYLKEMKKYNGGKRTGLMDNKDVQHYFSILKNVSTDIKEILRTWIGQNHFIDRSEQEFYEYIDDKFKEIVSIVQDKLNELYQTNQFSNAMSREDLFELNTEMVRTVAEKEFRKMFVRIRDIAREKREEKRKIYNDKNEFTAQILSGQNDGT